MRKETKNYIQSVTDYLTTTYGEVKPEWEIILSMLGYNLELLATCSKSIKENGIYNAQSGRKNPLLSTVKDLQATIIKQIQHLGLSPYAVSKIKNEVEDDTDDYIENLVS